MQWMDDIKIQTPEQIEVWLEIAGLGSRFVAQVLDWVIKWSILLLVALLAGIAAALGMGNFPLRTFPVLLAALVVGMFYAFLLGFDVFYEVRRNGQTPGKKWAGIRVIREGGSPVDFQAAAIRNLLGLADFLPGFYLLGGFLMLVSPRGQRLGDMAAGTIVIRERALKPPADLQGAIETLASDEVVFTAEQLACCSPGDRYLLRSFFQRFQEMERRPRARLARKLADSFARKLVTPPAQPRQDAILPEVYLASLYCHLENWARHNQ